MNDELARLRHLAADCQNLATTFEPLHRAVLYGIAQRLRIRAEAVEYLQTLREER